jgi:hypothetical protein
MSLQSKACLIDKIEKCLLHWKTLTSSRVKLAMDDYSAHLSALHTEACELGSSVYQLEKSCVGCPHLDSYWRQMDCVEAKIQNLIPIVEHYRYIQYRIERHLSFGESLEDLG